MSNSDLLFENDEEIEDVLEGPQRKWKVLLVDDEPDIHEITILTLANFEFEGKKIEFLHAYSAKEALSILKINGDVALALIDVVMETNSAGLSLVKSIREELNNQDIRIILRTGQPGHAPERDIIRNYDINDYREKTELTSSKLYTIVTSSLRAYRYILALRNSQNNLLDERERIRVTLSSIGDAVITTNSIGEITAINLVAGKMIGCHSNDAIGRPLSSIFRLINSSTKAPVSCPVNKVLYSGQRITQSRDIALIRTDDTALRVSQTASPIYYEEKGLIGVVLVFRDISEDIKYEELLHKSDKSQALGRLSTNMAYAFKNHFEIISQTINSAENDFFCDKKNDYFKRVINEVFHCMAIANQFLSFSEKGRHMPSIINSNILLKALELDGKRVHIMLIDSTCQVKVNIIEFKGAVDILLYYIKDVISNKDKISIAAKSIVFKPTVSFIDYNFHGHDFCVLSFKCFSSCKIDRVKLKKLTDSLLFLGLNGENDSFGLSLVHIFVKRYNGFLRVENPDEASFQIKMYFPVVNK